MVSCFLSGNRLNVIVEMLKIYYDEKKQHSECCLLNINC